MSKEKMDKAAMLDPQRFQIAQSMSYMPGAPGAMMNNPMNVTSISPQPGSMSGVNEYPYGDSGLPQDGRMGGVYPAPPSQTPQNLGLQRPGLNAMAAQTQQPTPSAADQMEFMRLAGNAQQLGLVGGMMGPQSANEMAVVPGGGVPTGQQTGHVLGLQGVPSTEGLMSPDAGQMVPGSTPVKNKKKGKK